VTNPREIHASVRATSCATIPVATYPGRYPPCAAGKITRASPEVTAPLNFATVANARGSAASPGKLGVRHLGHPRGIRRQRWLDRPRSSCPLFAMRSIAAMKVVSPARSIHPACMRQSAAQSPFDLPTDNSQSYPRGAARDVRWLQQSLQVTARRCDCVSRSERVPQKKRG